MQRLDFEPKEFKYPTFLNSILKELNYKTNSGFCAGRAQTGIAAFLIGELHLHRDRIYYLENIWNEIQNLKNTIPKEKNLKSTSRYKFLMTELQQPDNLAFLHSIILYQKASSHPEIFGSNLSQFKIAEISQYASSLKLDANGGLHEAEHYLSIFSRTSLAKFFYYIAGYVVNNNIAMSFSCNRHRTSVCYSGVEKKWITINCFNIATISGGELANKVFDAHSSDNNSKLLPFSVRLFCLGNNKNLINYIVSKLNKDHDFKLLLTINHHQLKVLDKNQNNLLHLTSRFNHPTQLNNLLNSFGMDPNCERDRKRTALHDSAELNHIEIVKILLSRPNIKIDLKDNLGKSPLYLAAENGNTNCVKLLLEKSASPYISCECGTNSITIAAKNGSLDLLKIFIKEGFDLLIPDENNKTPLDYANEFHHDDMIEFLSLLSQPTFEFKSLLPNFLNQTFSFAQTKVKNTFTIFAQPQIDAKRLDAKRTNSTHTFNKRKGESLDNPQTKRLKFN